MKLSISILLYKSKEAGDQCLKTILQYPPSCEFEIFVSDNASGDGAISYLQERWGGKATITFVQNERNWGFGKAHNLIFKKARGEYFLILNPDIEVRAGTLDRLIAYLDTHPEAGLVAPQLIYEDGVVQDSYRRFPALVDQTIKRTFLRKIPWLKNRVRWYLMWNKDKEKTEPVDWLVGAFLMIRRDVFEHLKGFDERYFLFMEDLDLCRRIWGKGYKVVYHPESKAMHHHERLSAGGIREVFRKKTLRIHIVSAAKYFLKWAFRRKGKSGQ